MCASMCLHICSDNPHLTIAAIECVAINQANIALRSSPESASAHSICVRQCVYMSHALGDICNVLPRLSTSNTDVKANFHYR